MAVRFDVRRDVREVEKMLDKLQKSVGPRVLVKAINETARNAQTKAIKNAASQLKLPLKLVKGRFKLDGTKKGERTRIERATRSNKTATLFVYMRGIPVTQVALKGPKKPKKGGGVRTGKGAGGRFYKGAFWNTARGNRLVFKRRSGRRYPLMVPKIGVRNKLEKTFDNWTNGILGRHYFRKRYLQLINYEIEKLNNSGRGKNSSFRGSSVARN